MRLSLPQTISWYLVRSYCINFAILLFGLLSIIYLFDTVELLRRAAKFDNIALPIIFQMGLYKLPEVGQLLLPFAVLFSGMFTFWKLARHHELVIIRSAGLSIWQFLAPIVIAVLIIGLLQIMLINPLSALFISKYEKMESKYLERNASAISLSQQGLWLKQTAEDDNVIIHARRIKTPEWIFSDVIVFFFAPDRSFIKRIDSPSAKLTTGQWTFNNAVINQSGTPPTTIEQFPLKTNLTIHDLEESFAPIETIPFWKLRSYIRVMEETGLDSSALRVHFQNLLSQPLLYISMILLAACVSLQPARVQKTPILILSGIAIGFLVFFSSSFLQALGASQQIPIVIAAWFPAMISFLIGISILMVLEDG